MRHPKSFAFLTREHDLAECKRCDPLGVSEALGSRALFLIKIRELLPFVRKPLQKRSRLPQFAVPLVKLFDAIEDFFQANRVGVPHRSAAIGRKAVTVEIDDVDVDGAQSKPYFKNARALVHQSVDATIDNFILGDFALWNACFDGPFAD